MAIFRAQIGFPMDSALPRDVMYINPHYDGSDAQALANALKANLIANAQVATKPFTVRIYDATKPPPSYPLAEASQTGTAGTSAAAREVCLCLSYYAGYNRPRFRGRLYMPLFIAGGTLGLRPTTTQQNNVLGFKTTLGGSLPAGTSWCVYSKTSGGSATVSNVWVDDEWDIQRSRGLKGTSRVTATVP